MLSTFTKMRLFTLILLLLITACEKNSEGTTMTPTAIKIKVGEPGAEFLQRNNLPAKEHITKQPAGLNFYRYRWPTVQQGLVLIEHGKYSFKIPHALSVMGTEDIEHLKAGLAQFSINAGITAADTVRHDEARQEFITLLQKLLALGWKPLISYNYPRLTGGQAFKYFQEDTTYGVAPSYSPSLEQWLQIDYDGWYLHADDVFLEINFRRGVESKDPTMAAYLFSFNLHSKEEEAKAQFEGKDRDRWQELWVEKIKSLKQERYATEKELIQRGFTIYTSYEEPKIHPLDPVEP